MTPRLDHEERLVRYLLGGLDAEERDRIEERLFSDDGLHESLRATADDLIAAYSRGELPPEDRARFERSFLASERGRARLGFLRNVMTVTAEAAVPLRETPRRSSRWRSWAAAALLLLALGALLLWRRPPLFPRAAQVATPVPTAMATPNAPAAAPATSPVVLTVQLAARGGPVPLALFGGTRRARFEVLVPDAGPPSYDAILRRADGAEVWRAEDLAPARAGRPLAIEIPAQVLVAGDYQLALEGEQLREGGPAAKTSRVFTLHVTRP
jgi:anti-sigma factor RsiW